MKADKLRREYIRFFKEKNHQVFPSDSLVCADRSLLFTSAGMNQFKPYFLGQKKGVKQAVSCQRCLRTGDIEEVGKTPFHHTFFEMLGNFSFGSYFKKEAIAFAWEFLTRCLQIKKEKLWVSVYKDDQEAFDIWKNQIGLPADKIARLGEDKNFWPANVLKDGPNGPCGPCAEIFFDKGKSVGCRKESCSPACGCGRFVEIWNLVFTQFQRQASGKLTPLPQKNIDTGMGLERVASLLQQKDSNFEIDILYPAVAEVKDILGLKKKAKASQVNSIVDHCRAVIFSIADGVYPSNEACGYVVRKLLRKSLWTANLLGYKHPFVWRLVPLFAQLMKDPYPFLEEKAGVVEKIIKKEEENFLITLEEGKNKLEIYLDELKIQKKNKLDAKKLFCLYDTYGFPFELTKSIAGQNNVDVDFDQADKLLAKQKERSRATSKFSKRVFKEKPDALNSIGPTDFTGYRRLGVSAKIIKIFSWEKDKIKWNDSQESLGPKRKGAVILDKTPFYSESGGQLSDRGLIKNSGGKFFVNNVYKAGDSDICIHQGWVEEGAITLGEAQAEVDEKRRKSLARAHTATHLLQAALRKVLGEHVSQQGSLVDADRLRFDFTHFKALTSDQINKIEKLVNFSILGKKEVYKNNNIPLEEAKKEGALAFFKEKYAKKVRMVSIDGYGKELCAGTHLDNTSEAGGFAITSESSVKSGIRRIEAVTGEKFYQLFQEKRNYIESLAQLLRCGTGGVRPALEKTLNNLKESKLKADQLEKEKICSFAYKLTNSVKEKIEGYDFLVYDFRQEKESSGLNYSNFFDLLDFIKKKINNFFIFLVIKENNKTRFFCSSGQGLIKKGIGPKEFIARFKNELSLKGGGTDKLVQGIIDKANNNFSQKVKTCFIRLVKNENS